MEKVSGLENLGHDILLDNVFPLLTKQDILNVGLSSKALHDLTSDPAVWHDLYFRDFGRQPNPFTVHKWPEIYRWRSKGRLYTWGFGTLGRLGYNSWEVEDELRSGTQGVVRPRLVDQIESTEVADLAAGGFSFAILSGNGDILAVGDLSDVMVTQPRPGVVALPIHRGVANAYPGPPGFPRFRIGGVILPNPPPLLTNNPGSIGGATQSPSTGPLTRGPGAVARTDATPTIHHGPPAPAAGGRPSLSSPTRNSDSVENNNDPLIRSSTERYQLKKLRAADPDRKFVSISSGRKHLLALDTENRVYLWDITYEYYGTELQFAFNSTNATIRKILAGWNFSCALVEDLGIIVWKAVGHLQHRTLKDSATPVPVDYVVVPLTGFGPESPSRVVDMLAGEDFIVYLNSEGQLFYLRTDNMDEIPTTPAARLTGLENELGQLSKGRGRFFKLSGTFRNFAVFSDSDHIVMATKDMPNKPVVLAELQGSQCVNIAVGDYHFLALLRGGKLLSWGRESKHCGCLGLGQAPQVQCGVLESNGTLRVDKPTPVKVPGYVVAIAAAGWQSSAIITPIPAESLKD